MNTWTVGEGFARSGLRHSETLRSTVEAHHRLSTQEVPLCDVSLGRCVVMWGQSMEPVPQPCIGLPPQGNAKTPVITEFYSLFFLPNTSATARCYQVPEEMRVSRVGSTCGVECRGSCLSSFELCVRFHLRKSRSWPRREDWPPWNGGHWLQEPRPWLSGETGQLHKHGAKAKEGYSAIW